MLNDEHAGVEKWGRWRWVLIVSLFYEKARLCECGDIFLGVSMGRNLGNGTDSMSGGASIENKSTKWVFAFCGKHLQHFGINLQNRVVKNSEICCKK